MTTFGFRGRQIRYMTTCIRYGTKKIENFFFVSYALKMILKVFWTCFDDFCFSRSPNPLHDYMYKVWVKKSPKIYFVYNDVKMILKGFWTCFEDFWFSRLANPCVRYGQKNVKKFILFLMQYKWILMCFGRFSKTIVFRGRQIRYIYFLLINTLT